MQNEIESKIINIVKKLLENDHLKKTIDLKQSLSEEGIGLDSIKRLSLFTEVENQFNVEIPENYWGRHSFRNLDEIVQFIMQDKHKEK